jgi:hypothetical protein
MSPPDAREYYSGHPFLQLSPKIKKKPFDVRFYEAWISKLD